MKALAITGPAALAILLAASATVSAQITNGNFETGDLTGWTTYVTPNGTLGPAGFPNVISFDTNGSGSSLAAHFNVGNATTPNQPNQGGGLIQSISLSPGFYTLLADIASQDSPAGPNSALGLFSILVDGTVQGSTDLGVSPGANQIVRGTLNAGFTITTPGLHELRFQITRPFLAGNPSTSPQEYLDNIQLTGAPEPSSLILLGLGTFGLMSRRPWRRLSAGEGRSAND